MSCHQIQHRLSDFIDGHLTEAERREVAGHARACIPCRRLLQELQAISEAAETVDGGSRPERDLWPGIEARLEAREPLATSAGREEDAMDDGSVGSVGSVGSLVAMPARSAAAGRRNTMRGWGLAAAAALVLGVSVPKVIQWLPANQADLAERAAAEEEYELLVGQAAVARAEDGVLQTQRDLAETLAYQNEALDPETFELVAAEVEKLERAIGEIRVALDEHPDDRKLRLLLAARYRQERDLVHRLSRV